MKQSAEQNSARIGGFLCEGRARLALSSDWPGGRAMAQFTQLWKISQPRHGPLLTARKNGTLPAKSPKPVLGDLPARLRGRIESAAAVVHYAIAGSTVSYTPWLYELDAQARWSGAFSERDVLLGNEVLLPAIGIIKREDTTRHASQRMGALAYGLTTDLIAASFCKVGRDE